MNSSGGINENDINSDNFQIDMLRETKTIRLFMDQIQLSGIHRSHFFHQ